MDRLGPERDVNSPKRIALKSEEFSSVLVATGNHLTGELMSDASNNHETFIELEKGRPSLLWSRENPTLRTPMPIPNP